MTVSHLFRMTTVKGKQRMQFMKLVRLQIQQMEPFLQSLSTHMFAMFWNVFMHFKVFMNGNKSVTDWS